MTPRKTPCPPVSASESLPDQAAPQPALLVPLGGEAGGLLVGDLVERLHLLVLRHHLLRGVVGGDQLVYLGGKGEDPVDARSRAAGSPA